jgi:hypothetical protein
MGGFARLLSPSSDLPPPFSTVGALRGYGKHSGSSGNARRREDDDCTQLISPADGWISLETLRPDDQRNEASPSGGLRLRGGFLGPHPADPDPLPNSRIKIPTCGLKDERAEGREKLALWEIGAFQ